MMETDLNFRLLFGDITEQSADIINDSIDLIFTDPPYGIEYLYLYERLAKVASRVLKEGASLFAYAPQPYMPEIMKIFGREDLGLKYWWIICVKQKGNHSIIHGRKVFPTWKPLLWYVKGKKSNILVSLNDYIDSQKPTKGIHDWEQSIIEAGYVIKYLTVENQIVLDPFMGSGTTGIASIKLNRKFIGIEIDPLHFSNAQRRLSS